VHGANHGTIIVVAAAAAAVTTIRITTPVVADLHFRWTERGEEESIP
jgi:hypothetical protein